MAPEQHSEPQRPVFISHSSRDKMVADMVCQALEEQGMRCWIAPRDVPAGANWAEAIIEAIEAAVAVVLIFSEHANISQQVKNEIERAVGKNKRLFPLKIRPAIPSKDLEYFISRWHWLDASSAPLPAVVNDLVRALTPLVPSLEIPAVLPAPVVLPRQQRRHKRHKILLLGGAAVASLAVALIALVLLRPVADSAQRTQPAYEALTAGDVLQATALFHHLGRQPRQQVRSQGYAGLAAVAFAQGDAQQALQWAERAEQLDPEIVYSHVIRGHVLLQKGNVTGATVAYRTATEKVHGLSWQQAIAANRLGRIYAARGFVGTALNFYDQAIAHDQHMAAVYANKAHILTETGRPEEALVLYRKALELQPGDRLTAGLLTKTEQQVQLVHDPPRQAHLRRCATESLRAHEDGRKAAEPCTPWVSTPWRLAFLTMQRQGTPALRAGEEEFLADQITHALQQSEGITVLDPAMLAALLAVMQRPATDLAELQFARQVSHILTANLFGTGSIVHDQGQDKLRVRLLDTTTGEVKALASAAWPLEMFDGVAEQIAHDLLQQLRQASPSQEQPMYLTPIPSQ